MTILALAFSSVAFVHALLWLLLFFIIGLIIGWVLWHKCREEALATERENERLKQDQERLEREIREIREEIGAAA